MTAYSRYNRRFFALTVGIIMASFVLMPAQTRADLLPTDSNAMPAWQGSSLINSTFPSGAFSANVDYAVYDRGQFDLSFPGQDPSGGAQYVYAYQILNSLSSSASIQEFTVGLDGDESPANIGSIADPVPPSGNAENLAYFSGSPATSAVWSYADSMVSPGAESRILIFTSPNPPEWDLASLLGTRGSIGQAPGSGLPGPVPEPGALLGLIAIGCAFFLVRRLRRQCN
jgi:hypothetical protein